MTNVIKLTKEEAASPSLDSVIFTNSEAIDMRAVTIMGISAKTSSDAIGYFGTGLKYAIAVLLREGMEIVIFSGEEKHVFKRKQTSFRGKDFEVITMNGKELPFTTELGKNWEVWQAYRELYCNCTDEKGVISIGTMPSKGLAGHTIVSVKGDKILTEHDRRKLIILDSQLFFKNDEIEVSRGSNHSLFYKGIKVLAIKHSLYTYNFKCPMTLTEDRTLSYFWAARGKIMNMVLESEDKAFIKDILTAPEGSYEADFNFMDDSEATATPSTIFLDVARELEISQKRMNSSARGIIQKHTAKASPKEVSNLSDYEKGLLQESINNAIAIGFAVTDYPIVITENFDAQVLGLAENGVIYASRRCFDLGGNELTAVLIEEFIHLKFELRDESRGMQNFLFEKVVSLGLQLLKRN